MRNSGTSLGRPSPILRLSEGLASRSLSMRNGQTVVDMTVLGSTRWHTQKGNSRQMCSGSCLGSLFPAWQLFLRILRVSSGWLLRDINKRRETPGRDSFCSVGVGGFFPETPGHNSSAHR